MNATTPALSVASLTIDCADPAALAAFWAKVLGRPVGPGATAENATLDAADPVRPGSLDPTAPAPPKGTFSALVKRAAVNPSDLAG